MVEVELSQLTFTLLDEDGRDHVRRGMDLAFFERDEIILEMGQPGVSVFLIHKGEVAECTSANIFGGGASMPDAVAQKLFERCGVLEETRAKINEDTEAAFAALDALPLEEGRGYLRGFANILMKRDF